LKFCPTRAAEDCQSGDPHEANVSCRMFCRFSNSRPNAIDTTDVHKSMARTSLPVELFGNRADPCTRSSDALCVHRDLPPLLEEGLGGATGTVWLEGVKGSGAGVSVLEGGAMLEVEVGLAVRGAPKVVETELGGVSTGIGVGDIGTGLEGVGVGPGVGA
jgi:hypothetical protein